MLVELLFIKQQVTVYQSTVSSACGKHACMLYTLLHTQLVFMRPHFLLVMTTLVTFALSLRLDQEDQLQMFQYVPGSVTLMVMAVQHSGRHLMGVLSPQHHHHPITTPLTGSQLYTTFEDGSLIGGPIDRLRLYRGPDYNSPDGEYCCVLANQRRCVTLSEYGGATC